MPIQRSTSILKNAVGALDPVGSQRAGDVLNSPITRVVAKYLRIFKPNFPGSSQMTRNLEVGTVAMTSELSLRSN
jgi:hypothetical protein